MATILHKRVQISTLYFCTYTPFLVDLELFTHTKIVNCERVQFIFDICSFRFVVFKGLFMFDDLKLI